MSILNKSIFCGVSDFMSQKKFWTPSSLLKISNNNSNLPLKQYCYKGTLYTRSKKSNALIKKTYVIIKNRFSCIKVPIFNH